MNKKMRDIRKALGMSQYALAAAAGSSPPTIIYVERYGHIPGPELQQRIAAALAVTPADLWPKVAT